MYVGLFVRVFCFHIIFIFQSFFNIIYCMGFFFSFFICSLTIQIFEDKRLNDVVSTCHYFVKNIIVLSIVLEVQ